MGFLDDIIDEERSKQWIDQGTEEWNRVRVGRFTSSEMWRLMTEPKTIKAKEAGQLSEGATTYVYEKVAEVFTGQLKQQGYAFPLVYGKEQEPFAIEHFCQTTGLTWEACGFFPFGDHAGGSPDGNIGDDEIIEVKCPYDQEKQIEYLMLTDQWDLKRNFPKYYWQCQANLLFTKKSLCHFVTFDPRYEDKFKMTHIKIKPNSEDMDLITQKIAKAVEEKLKLLKLLKR